MDVEVQMQQIGGGLALAGEGVALITPSLWREELADGRLIQPLDLIVGHDHAFWFVTSKGRRRSPKIQAFRDWIVAELAPDASSPSS